MRIRSDGCDSLKINCKFGELEHEEITYHNDDHFGLGISRL